MQVHLTLTQSSQIVVRNERRFSDKAYLDFCETNSDLQVERTAEGDIVLVPPAGSEPDYRCNKGSGQLDRWTEKNGRGKAFGPTVQFFLPDGSALSPDASWVSNESLAPVPYEDRRGFVHLCPKFVVEVLSPSDRLVRAKAKMERWIANGVQLAWLVDGDAQTTYVYQPNQPVETRKGILKLAGKGPVKGFVLQLRTIWKGLK